MKLRDRQRAQTRESIVNAAAALLVSGDEALSIPAVADRAGVSIRTVYRYFATKTDLVEAVAHVDDPAQTAGAMPAVDGSDLHEWLTRGWSVEVQTPLLRAQLRTASGVDVRRARRRRHRAFAEAVLDDWEVELTDDARRSVADLLLLMTGGAALVELTDVLESSVERATASAAWAVEAILHHALRTGGPPQEGDMLVMQKPKSDGKERPS